MSVVFGARDTVLIHKKLVAAAMRHVIGLEQVDGRSPEQVVEEYYGRLSPKTQLLVTHDDPLWLAFELAGERAPLPEDGASYREKFDRLRPSIVFQDRWRRSPRPDER